MTNLYSKMRNGYVQAGKKLLSMPLTNTMLPLLTVMDPVFLSHQQTASSFQRLDSFMPSYTTDNKLMGKLASETNKYKEDADIKQLADDFNPAENIDTGFWMKVFTLESFNKPRYPAMKSLVTACSPNPDIQWATCRVQFQHQGRYCEKDRASLTVKNYEAVAIVKCTLRKGNLKPHKTKVDPTRCSCNSMLTAHTELIFRRKELKQHQLQQKLIVSVLQLKAEKATRVQKLLSSG